MALQEKQTESAAQITLNVNGTEYRCKSVDTSIDVDIEMIYGNNLKPDGWAVNQIEYSGSLGFHGDVKEEITPKLHGANDEGVPSEGHSITITHADGSSTTFEDVFMSSGSYSMSEGDVTETTYDWVAMDRSGPSA